MKLARLKRPKLHLVYYLLAAFDLVAIATSLYLNHEIMSIYVGSVDTNQDWARKVTQLVELSELAQRTNAPGNDVFDTKNVPGERRNRDAALAEFQRRLADISDEFARIDDSSIRQRFEGSIANIDFSMAAMVSEADHIFGHFERGEENEAGRRMATMDRRYADVTGAVTETIHILQDIQRDEFETQIVLANSLKKLELVVAGVIVLMILFVTWYGDKIAKVLRANEDSLNEAKENAEIALLAANEAQSQLTDAIESIPDGFGIWDSEDRLVLCNERYKQLYPDLRDHLSRGSWIGDFFRAGLERGVFNIGEHKDIESAVQFRLSRHRSEGVIFEHELGDGRWIRVSKRRTKSGYTVSLVADVTERVESEETIRRLATEDALTGLPNRAQFGERLLEAIDHANRTGRKVGVMLLDLDHFKTVNDTLGHAVGDQLLVQVARRLSACVRKTDIVARLGGDEFAVIITNAKEVDGIQTAGQKIIDVLGQPFRLSDKTVHTGTSIGATIYPEDKGDQEQLLGNADLALYKAKAEGRGKLWLFDREMHAQMRADAALEDDLRHALGDGQFHMAYQPQVDIRTGAIIGAESLLRWQHPVRGLVSPGAFIPLAEKTRQIIDISRWVLHDVCRQIAEWHAAGAVDYPVSVNISPLHFRHENLIHDVRAALEASGIDPQWLELEITEGMAMAAGVDALTTLNELKAMGLGLAIDDFGTGYSSLNRLKEFPIDRLKIDQSFVRDVTVDTDDAAICSAVIQLGHTLNLRVIAEGVETLDQLAFLTEMRCDEIQGFLVGKPMRAGEWLDFARSFDPARPLAQPRAASGDERSLRARNTV